jgi:3-hydroxyisobutyrate dehydrogenase-like beta-hydroxyacid dehydrogenase
MAAVTGAVRGRRIGFVGAGRIGEPMVERLLDAGADVSLYVRNPETARRLAARGARLMARAADIASGASLVIVCVFSDSQLADVAASVMKRLEPGAVLVSHTTGSPALIRRLDEMACPRGASVADAAFSGTYDDVRAGRLTVLLGGSADVADRCEPVLRCYASTVVRTGPAGSAMAAKLVNNLLFTVNAQIAVETCRLAADLGIDQQGLLAAIQHCSGATRALEHLAEAGGPEEFGCAVAPYLRKDFAVCEQLAAESGTSLRLLGDVARLGAIEIAAP